jgi:copper(I)-binding protein
MFKKFLAAMAVVFGLVTLTGCSAPAAPEQTTNSVTIEDAWVRSSEYSAKAGGMTGIFGKFTNNGTTDVTIIGGETDAAAMVQVHEVVDGMMQEKKGGIVIKPGETVTLEPGGLHIMIMNITKAIVAGDKLSITIKFDGAEPQTLDLVAKDSAGGDEEYSE